MLTRPPDLEPLSLKRHVCLDQATTNGAPRAVHRLLLELRGPTYSQYPVTLASRDTRGSAEPLSGKAIARLWPMMSATLSPLPQRQLHGLVTRPGDTQHEPPREARTATNVSVLAADVLDLELDR